MNKITIPKEIIDEVHKNGIDYFWKCGDLNVLAFAVHSVTLMDFLEFDGNEDILMAYLNPLTRDYVEVVE